MREGSGPQLLRSSLSEENDGRERGRGRWNGSDAGAIRAMAEQPFGKGSDPGRAMEARDQCRPAAWRQPCRPATASGCR
jgi:hypothetical protein